MKLTKRILALVITIVMLVGMIPAISLPTFAASSDPSLVLGNGTLTRAEWLHNLVQVFEMSVESESLPDNYFSDLSSTHKYYKDILVATEFGVVDVEAGENISPDENVTRDFAAATLNFCLGYQLGEDPEYSFSDVSDCYDPDSAQIAIDREWLALVDGAFCPVLELTSSEAETMLDDAMQTVAAQYVDSDYESTYEFASDVKVIPETTTVTQDEDGKIYIDNCPEALLVGDKVAVYFGGIPSVYSVTAVSVEDNITVISTEILSADEGFETLDAQGTVSSDTMEIVPVDGVDVSIEEDDSSAYSARAIKKTKNIVSELPISFGGVTGKIAVKINNPYIDYYVDSGRVYVALCGDTEVTYSISGNLMGMAGLNNGVTLFKCNVLGIGSFDVSVNFNIEGSASGTVKGFLTAGVEVVKGEGLRAVKSFQQKEYYTSVNAATSVSLRASLGVTQMPIISAYVYAEVGVRANFSKKTFAEGTPKQCTHFAAYLFAQYGASASAKFGIWKTSESVSYTIFGESNSPVRIVNHYEDGNLVPTCTRGTSYSNFFTKANSRWSGSGWTEANGAYGLNADGSYFALYNYTLNETQKATITKYNGNSSYVNIPETIDGYTVVAVGSGAFKDKSVAYVTMPDTIKKIGSSAFAGCTNLKTVNLSQSLTEIGSQAFFNCYSLSEIELPKSLTTLNAAVFNECDSLKEIFIPKALKETGSDSWGGPFARCSGLKSVTFEENITKIPAVLFDNCDGLEEITIPDTVTLIKGSAFANCTNLKTVNLSQSLTEIGSQAFFNCYSLSEIELPKSLTTLNAAVFNECDSLKEIFIPKALKETGSDSWGGPFARCSGLKSVTFEENITKIPAVLFDNCDGLEEITIPDTVTLIKSSAFANCTNLKSIKLSNNTKEIQNSAFSDCVSLKSITIPDSVTSIADRSFYNCTSLKNVTLSKSLTSLGYSVFAYAPIESIEIPKSLDSAGCSNTGFSHKYVVDGVEYSTNLGNGPFYRCDKLKNVTFEKGTTQIADALFAGCTGLEKIEIPDTVTTIESNAFYGCPLTDVTIGNAVTSINNRAFSYCVLLPEITLSDSVTDMGTYCFSNCTSLESVKLPGSRVNITEGTFLNCKSLKTIELSAILENIENRVFENCTSLESFSFPKGSNLKTIGAYAFYGCSSLKEAIIPESVTSISNYAFRNCTSLEKVYIPQSTKTIGIDAFIGCEKLSDVTISDYSISKIDSNTFKDCPALTKIVLPKGLKTIGSQAFMNCTSLVDVTIPESVTSINSTAFSYPAKTTIRGKKGSYAETFAKNGGFTFADNDIFVEGMILKDGVENVDIEVGETYRAEFEFYPEDANDVVTLTASNSNVTLNFHDIYGRYNGDTVVTATATSGLTYEFNVHIRKVNKIQISALPTKTTFNIGEDIDLSGMVVQAVYNDGYIKDVQGYTISGYNSEAEGSCTVTVKYTALSGSTYSSSFTVTIVDPAPKLTGIFVGTMPNKTEYALREKLDTTGLVIMGSYTDGVARPVTGFTTSGFNALKKGEQTITVKLGEFSTSFTVFVGVSKTIDRIEMSTLPAKTVYEIGESFDGAGASVKVYYTDGTSEVISSGLEFTGYSLTTAGTKTVTVTYKSKTCSFEITVNPQELAFSTVSVTITDNFAVNVKVDSNLLTASDYAEAYVLFEMNGKQYREDSYSFNSGKCVFTFEDISPEKMTDVVSATLYAKRGGVQYSSDLLEFTVAGYCYDLLANNSSDTKLRTLIVDMLCYGAESQRYTGYKTNSLADSNLTNAQKAWATETVEIGSHLNKEYTKIENPEITWSGVGLNLDSAVAMKVKFKAEDMEGVTLKVSSISGGFVYDSDDFVKTAYGYSFYFDELIASQMREKVYFTFYKNGVAISDTLCYSVESYVSLSQNNEALSVLTMAMLKYSDSAKAYSSL